jgi:peptide/nickel transport system permease protein
MTTHALERHAAFFNSLPTAAKLAGFSLLFWCAIALLGPWISPHDPGDMLAPDIFLHPSREFPLGSDFLGRDLLSRIIDGVRLSVMLAGSATALAIVIGAGLGMLAATLGGWIDAVLTRVADAMLSIPSLIFGLVVVAAIGSSLPVLIITVAVIYAPGAFRISRAFGREIGVMDFVTAARARGEGVVFLVLREIMPNMVLPLLTDLGVRFVFVLLLISSLSFLGLGVQPPAADLGALVRENFEGLSYGAPAALLPALVLAILTVSVNLFVDGLSTAQEQSR